MTRTSDRERLHVLSFEPLGSFGGLDVYDRSFHEALLDEGSVDVTWVTSDRNTSDGLPYPTWTPFRRVFGTGSLVAQGLRYARGLAQLVRRAAHEARHRPTVIHQQFLTVPVLELGAMMAAQRAGVPWIITPHEPLPYSGSRRDATVRRRIYRSADALIALSTSNRADLEALTGVASGDVTLTPLGHFNAFRGPGATMDAQAARRTLGIDANAPTVLFLGEMRPVKGLDCLIRAMPAVLAEVPNARLIIAGRPYRFDPTGPHRLIDQLGVAHAVTARWEFVPAEEMALYFRAADVVALPYRAASQSGACHTAYAYRRTVAASRVGGLTEQVADGVTGLLVPPDDAPALAGALVRLLRDPAEARRMGERAHEWVARERPWDAVARTTIDAYRLAWERRSRAARGRSRA
jgi:glycosyltransferase involved in cell wall biosynthesis